MSYPPPLCACFCCILLAMRYLQEHGRRAAWVIPSHSWRVQTTSPPQEATSKLPPQNTKVHEETETEPAFELNHEPLSPKNPGKRLIQHVPAHVWVPSSPAIQNLEQIHPPAAAMSTTNQRPPVTKTTGSRHGAPTRYPDEMRQHIRFWAQYRLRHPARS